ncbi:MAG: glycosyltransferase, partial [Tissierellales bacterium]|nr:glycosyltransferase [Tissierellales bacterium]
MNAFIEMRKVYFENNQGVSFPEFYLKNHSFFNEENDEYRLSLINKMASIRRCYTDEKINEIQMVQALDDLGENVYLDRYIVDLVIKHKALINGNLLRKELLDRLVDPINTSRILCHLLDICIECDVPLLTGERLRQVFFQHEKDFDALSMLLAYLTHFCIDDFTDVLLEHLGRDIPENIKMQIIDGLLACHFNKKDLKQMLEQKLSLGSNTNIYLDYLNFTEGEEVEHDAKIVLFQTAFFGNPEFSGKGISGGLGTLLRTLGNQLVRHQEVSRVITLTINNNWQDGKPFMSYLADHHWLIRLPVYMDNEDQQAFVTKELMIKRSVAKFIKKWQINPDVFHVRYLDNASRTIGLLCKALGAKLVFTLTPDPHRSMVDQAGELAVFRIGETLERLNKIVVGDELLTLADGVVGIGADDVIEELERYFPQLKQPNNPFAFQMIGEGIDIETNPLNFELWTFLRAHAFTHSIDRSHESKPVILNVGRLNRQKGQDRLIKVWGESRLWKDFNLIIIGGNREQLDDEATKMMKSFDEYIKDNPHLKG